MLGERREFYTQMAMLMEEIDAESRRALEAIDRRYDSVLRELHVEFNIPYPGYSNIVGRGTCVPLPPKTQRLAKSVYSVEQKKTDKTVNPPNTNTSESTPNTTKSYEKTEETPKKTESETKSYEKTEETPKKTKEEPVPLSNVNSSKSGVAIDAKRSHQASEVVKKTRNSRGEMARMIREVLLEKRMGHKDICLALKEKGMLVKDYRKFSNNVNNKIKHLMHSGKIVYEGEAPHRVYEWVD